MLEAVVDAPNPLAQTARAVNPSPSVSVYTRHKNNCSKNSEPYWKRCNCMKYLYVYCDGRSRQISAKTRSWEKAEQTAQKIRASFDPASQLQQQLEAKSEAARMELIVAINEFAKEMARLNREDATRAKYRLTLSRLQAWCRIQALPIHLLSQLDVPTVRRWINSWEGAPTTRHNQHQRVITFFNFCIEQGWIKENPAKKIRKVQPEQEETLPFTPEQYDALLEATYDYDSRRKGTNRSTVNSRRVRAYSFPNLLTFHDAPTSIEQKLFVMYLEHRMRAFQGSFHASPDYALWYGWSEMQRDLTEIKEQAAELRRAHAASIKTMPRSEGALQ